MKETFKTINTTSSLAATFAPTIATGQSIAKLATQNSALGKM